MQKIIQKFRQSSTVFEKPAILSESLKTLIRSEKLKKIWFLHTRFLHFY